MNNFYKGGRELVFSQREEGACSRKAKPPRLSKNLTKQAVGESVNLPSTTVWQLVRPGSDQLRDRFAFCSAAVRELFGSCSAFAEAEPNNTRRSPEPVPSQSRSRLEAEPKNRRTVSEETRDFFVRFLGKLKARIKYRCSKDVVLFTQRLRKIDEVPLMYRECTVCVRGVYRKGTKEVLERYWRATKDVLTACTSGVDQRYSNKVEAVTNKVTLCLTGLLCFMLFNLSDAWAQSAESRTAEGQTEIKPLKTRRHSSKRILDG